MQHGHGIERGRALSSDLELKYGSKPVEVNELKESYLMFFLQNSYSPTLTEQELYDATRQYWYNISEFTCTPGPDTVELPYKIALAVVDSVVVEVYSIEAWFLVGSTFSSRRGYMEKNDNKRWEFVGQIQKGHKLKGKRLQKDGKNLPANQNGFGYIN